MFSKIAYHLLLRPLSKLPLPILYGVADFFYLILLTIFPYRKKVIERNLRMSFPEKNAKQIKMIRQQFYRHFSDLLAESIYNFSVSRTKLLKRVQVRNPELMDDLYAKNKSVLLVSGHYNNWEWMITAQNLLFPHQAVGIGAPLTNQYFDQKITGLRSRFGMQILHASTVKQGFKELEDQVISTLILSDQSPVDATKAYWTKFLNQDTAVLFGCEMLAHEHQHAVVFFEMIKIKRGYYMLDLKLITEDPSQCEWGSITQQHTQLLEEVINREPAYWLWSHKRWKRDVPANLNELKLSQKMKFDKRFGM